MPRVIEPSGPKVGPLGMRQKSATRRSRYKTSRPATTSSGSSDLQRNDSVEAATKKTFIGEDILKMPDRSSHQTPKPVQRSSTTGQGKASSKKQVPVRPLGVEHEFTSEHPQVAGLSSRALAVDTRFLEMSGDHASLAATQSKYYRDFLRTLAVRGACPSVVVSTTLLSKSVKRDATPLAAAGIGTNVHRLDSQAWRTVMESESFLQHVPVQPLESNVPLLIPLALTAASSWNLFGNMVESIVSEYRKLCPSEDRNALDITILTTDVALYCDTTVNNHEEEATRFVRRLTPLFANSQVKSVQIQTSLTDTLELQFEACDKMDCDTAPSEETKAATSTDAHKLEMTKCIQAVDSILDKWEFPGSSHMGVSATHEVEIGVIVNHSVMAGSVIGFKLLTRQWIRDIFASHHLRCRLNFDLPATADGTQCSVELEPTYQILPFAIDSPHAKMMLKDLNLFSELTISVVQLVPLATIDASLLFGIPMKVSSSLGSNSDEFQEMEFLVRSLFGLLQEREMAMVLRGTQRPPSSSTSYRGLFQSHASSSDHFFVLMAQEVSTGNAPTSGVLHRVAHADQLFAEVSPVSSKSNEGSNHSETEAQYTEYVEAAFAEIELLPFNPLSLSSHQYTLHDEERAEDSTEGSSSPEADAEASVDPIVNQSPVDPAPMSLVDDFDEHPKVDDDHPNKKDSVSSVWSDTAGVGACGPRSNQDALLDGEVNALGVQTEMATQGSSIWNDSAGVGALGAISDSNEGNDSDVSS